jgi:nitroreductase
MATVCNGRSAEYDIDPLFLERWSPRAMSAAPLSEALLMTLFDAARWAPSAFNAQPWRFVYALRDTPEWASLFGVLNPFNQTWAVRASAVVIICSQSVVLKTDGSSSPSHSHSFDAGAAWAQFALQATRMGLVVHGMTGIDFDAAARAVGLPEHYRVEAAAVVGWPGDKSVLPEALQAREQPSGRKPVSEIAFPGKFPAA